MKNSIVLSITLLWSFFIGNIYAETQHVNQPVLEQISTENLVVSKDQQTTDLAASQASPASSSTDQPSMPTTTEQVPTEQTSTDTISSPKITTEAVEPALPVKKKKKVLIFTSKGGYGHQAACSSLKQLLTDDYELTIINPFEELLNSFDMVKKLSGNSMDGEQLYNWLLQKNWIGFTNISCKYIAPSMVQASGKTKQKIFLEYVTKQNPDLVVSVIPFLNLPISNAAHELNIPFLLITLDGDITQWTLGMEDMKHTNFVTTIGFENEKTRPLLNECGIKDEKIALTGFPIRTDFLEKKDTVAIKKQWSIPENKFVIMIMMGGVGSSATYHYAKRFSMLNLNAHLLICVGKNENLKNKIARLKFKENTTYSLIPFTNEVSNLMAASDLLITKAGPGSIYEALFSELPMLIDKTTTTLFWENANTDMVTKNNWGGTIPSFRKMEGIVRKFMEDQTYYQEVKSSLKAYQRQDFMVSIKPIINKLCPPFTS